LLRNYFFGKNGEKINRQKLHLLFFYSLDNAFRLKVNKDPLTIIEDKRNPNILSDLFFIFYKEENFRTAFWNKYHSLLESRIISYDLFKSIVDENVANITSEIQLQIEKYEAPRTMIEWNIELDKMLTLFQERETAVYNLVE